MEFSKEVVMGSQYPGQPDRWGRIHRLTVFVQSSGAADDWALPAAVFLGYTSNNQELQVLGWAHAVKAKP